MLGAVFLGLGYAVSAIAGSTASAAGLAAGLWLVAVVRYDLGLLGAVVADGGHVFTREVFPWLLVANPADAFRIWNLATGETVALASGMAAAARSLPPGMAAASLFAWPILVFLLAWAAFRRTVS